MLGPILSLPLAPVHGLVGLARVLRDQAEQELYDPATVQRQLEELSAAAAAGELSDEELAAAEQQIIDRLVG
ncbi:gas vesicle protein GvpG [Polymorphospora sp. NPDC050346]|uniref:gas vesicle protein GvpG n=1 Tax=Polymorphospora sp. NPDC050346 TaxID=3155780 RepID=UPI0033C7E295